MFSQILPVFYRIIYWQYITLLGTISLVYCRGSLHPYVRFPLTLFQMDCDICLELFDSSERRPKVLPCGHTYCLRCLGELRKKACPADRKVSLRILCNVKRRHLTNKPCPVEQSSGGPNEEQK